MDEIFCLWPSLHFCSSGWQVCHCFVVLPQIERSVAALFISKVTGLSLHCSFPEVCHCIVHLLTDRSVIASFISKLTGLSLLCCSSTNLEVCHCIVYLERSVTALFILRGLSLHCSSPDWESCHCIVRLQTERPVTALFISKLTGVSWHCSSANWQLCHSIVHL